MVQADQRGKVGEKSSRRGAKGRTSGITERKMASLKRKLNHRLTDSSSSRLKNLRTVGRRWTAIRLLSALGVTHKD